MTELKTLKDYKQKSKYIDIEKMCEQWGSVSISSIPGSHKYEVTLGYHLPRKVTFDELAEQGWTYDEDRYNISIETLRDNAIEWIKEFREYEKNCDYPEAFDKFASYISCVGDSDEKNFQPTIEWIKRFFNIDEKDLA